MTLVIVDTGCANLSSVAFAFERLGGNAEVTDDTSRIKSADRVIIPGVGSAPYAMACIEEKGLTDTLQSLNQPVLGICLGMQLLFDELDEGGRVTKGLGLIPGRVVQLDTKGQPAPHMGWNTLEFQTPHPLLKNVQTGEYAYFVHSYAVPVIESTIASAAYGTTFSAIVGYKNVYGCQFHPERSSQTGAKILKNFLEMPS
jgi:glutamine amidotransferase